MTEPRWRHDCRQCQYQGRRRVDDQDVDWYICPSPSGDTLIGRYGDDGAAYWSMPRTMLAAAAAAGNRFARVALDDRRVERMAMEPDDWTRVQYVYELVKNEGDAECGRVLDDLIAEVRRLDLARGESLARAEQAERDRDNLGVHLRHCNLDDNVGTCKYGDFDCPALTEPWRWFGDALTRSQTLADRMAARVLDDAIASLRRQRADLTDRAHP